MRTRRYGLLMILLAATLGTAQARPDILIIRHFSAGLRSASEVPAIISPGRGAFSAAVSRDRALIEYKMGYETVGEVLQAHIHVGQRDVNGGVAVFLCSNLDSAPQGVQACPATPGELSGMIMAADVIGPAGQGIEAGDLESLLAAMVQGLTYVNVHSDLYPGGELRGQLRLRPIRRLDPRRDDPEDSDGDLDHEDTVPRRR